MSEVKYSKEHEWIKIEGDVGTVGITQHATEMLGRYSFCRVTRCRFVCRKRW